MNGNIKYATLYILLLLQQWVNRCYDDGSVHRRRRRRVRVRHDIIIIMRNYWLIEDDIFLTLILS